MSVADFNFGEARKQAVRFLDVNQLPTDVSFKHTKGDIPVLVNNAGHEVCFISGIDLWKGDKFIKYDASKEEAVAWLSSDKQ